VLAAYSAGRTIDADGHVVVPGLIDAHLHMGLALLRGWPRTPATG
jgi:cytosine/adenosine deaminase-related metal-dependent hydrolase